MSGRLVTNSDAYVRMSTDHQKYSTENQLDVIRSYATARGLQILRVFEDSGRSGLRLDGREALQNLMAEVQSGRADFKAILVYDVSRWGRFQDADEGAYHEHVCSRAGIRVLHNTQPVSIIFLNYPVEVRVTSDPKPNGVRCILNLGRTHRRSPFPWACRRSIAAAYIIPVAAYPVKTRTAE